MEGNNRKKVFLHWLMWPISTQDGGQQLFEEEMETDHIGFGHWEISSVDLWICSREMKRWQKVLGHMLWDYRLLMWSSLFHRISLIDISLMNQ
jgi:hypothetical protein